jgi:hypothetical protein
VAGLSGTAAGTVLPYARECTLSLNTLVAKLSVTCGTSKFATGLADVVPAGASGKAGTCNSCDVTPCTTLPCMVEGTFSASTATGGATTFGDSTTDTTLLGAWKGGSSWSLWAPRDISRVGTGPSAGFYVVVGEKGTVGVGGLTGSFNYLKVAADQDNHTFVSIDARGDYTYIVGRHNTGLLDTGDLVLLIHDNALALDAKESWSSLVLASCGPKCYLGLAAVSGNASGVYVVGNETGMTATPAAVVWYLPAP